MLVSLEHDFDVMDDMYKLLLSSIKDEAPLTVREGGMIKDGFDKELDRLRHIMQNGSSVVAEIEAREEENTKDCIYFNSWYFGYFLNHIFD